MSRVPEADHFSLNYDASIALHSGDTSRKNRYAAICVIARPQLMRRFIAVACLAVQRGSGGGDRMMNPRRRAQVALALCGTVGLAGWVIASLAGFGSTRIEHASAAVPVAAAPIEDRRASLIANASLADEPQAIAMGNAVVASAEVATAAEPAAGTATDTTAASDKPESIVVAALPDPSQTLSADLPPVQELMDQPGRQRATRPTMPPRRR